MAGWLTPGMPLLTTPTGAELFEVDTQIEGGANPQSASVSLQQLAVALAILGNVADKTTVAGTRYYVNVGVGYETDLTGIAVRVGTTGGTDKWIAELHDSTGALVATSATAGATTGAAGTFQKLDFTAPYHAEPGEYYIAVQSNGTTAKLGVYAAADLDLVTGSAAGTFGTGASITPPTTYTASTGPIAQLY